MVTDYGSLLAHSYEVERISSMHEPCGGHNLSKLEYLSEYIFQFVTYHSEIAEKLAMRAVEVCAAITLRTTFEYIREPIRYEWFIVMCNMPFFADRITWGSSIRGAFWDQCSFTSTGLWVGDDQMSEEIDFPDEEWSRFCRAIIEFAEADEI